jgi:hypothetical protein
MVDFSNLKRFNVSPDSIVPFRLTQLDGEPVLQVAPATEANKTYFNALLAQTKESLRELSQKGASAESVELQRELAKELFAVHIVRGWSGVLDVAGNEVPWTRANCVAFLDALPGWIFDRIRDFCSNSANFIGPREAAPAELDATAKN